MTKIQKALQENESRGANEIETREKQSDGKVRAERLVEQKTKGEQRNGKREEIYQWRENEKK